MAQRAVYLVQAKRRLADIKETEELPNERWLEESPEGNADHGREAMEKSNPFWKLRRKHSGRTLDDLTEQEGKVKDKSMAKKRQLASDTAEGSGRDPVARIAAPEGTENICTADSQNMLRENHSDADEAILEKKARERMEAEDRIAIAETEGAIAVRRLLEKRNAREAKAIHERIADEMAQSESAASSAGPEVPGSCLQTVDADPCENVPVVDTVSQYRARVDETKRQQETASLRFKDFLQLKAVECKTVRVYAICKGLSFQDTSGLSAAAHALPCRPWSAYGGTFQPRCVLVHSTHSDDSAQRKWLAQFGGEIRCDESKRFGRMERAKHPPNEYEELWLHKKRLQLMELHPLPFDGSIVLFSTAFLMAPFRAFDGSI